MINVELKKGRMNLAIPPASNDCYMRKLNALSDAQIIILQFHNPGLPYQYF